MVHGVVTIKRGKAERCRESWVSKSRDPREELWKPPTPGAISLMCHMPAKLSLIIYPPSPTWPQHLLFPTRINHPVLCSLCKPSPSPGHTVPSSGAAVSPTRLGARAREEMDGGRVFVFIYALVPTQKPGSQGTGEPPQLPASDPTLLPTWTPLRLEGALTGNRCWECLLPGCHGG